MVESYLADVATLPRFTHTGCELPHRRVHPPHEHDHLARCDAEHEPKRPSFMRPHARLQFWDGRADTLWVEATGPFENASENGSNRLALRRAQDRGRLQGSIRRHLASSPFPALDDATRLPNGKPREPAWDAMDGRQSGGERHLRARRQAHRGLRANGERETEPQRPASDDSEREKTHRMCPPPGAARRARS